MQSFIKSKEKKKILQYAGMEPGGKKSANNAYNSERQNNFYNPSGDDGAILHAIFSPIVADIFLLLFSSPLTFALDHPAVYTLAHCEILAISTHCMLHMSSGIIIVDAIGSKLHTSRDKKKTLSLPSVPAFCVKYP